MTKPLINTHTDAQNGFNIESSTNEPTVMDDITLTCKASVYNYTKLNWFWRPLNDKEDDTHAMHNLSGERTSSDLDDRVPTHLTLKLTMY